MPLAPFTPGDEIIDSRDIIERIELLESDPDRDEGGNEPAPRGPAARRSRSRHRRPGGDSFLHRGPHRSRRLCIGAIGAGGAAEVHDFGQCIEFGRA